MRLAKLRLLSQALPYTLCHCPPPFMAGRKRCKTQTCAAGACNMGAAADRVKLVIVGDVHDQYGPEDEAALAFLQPDATIFVGDFGEENLTVVRTLASGSSPRAVLLGNHDAWYSLSSQEPDFTGAQAQLDMLGNQHVGFSSARFTAKPGQLFTIAGARPFSKGGDAWERVAGFYASMYGVGSMEESSERIITVLKAAAGQAPVIVVAHNGPAGLGDKPHDICGRDWRTAGGDHGDPDLQAALQHAQEFMHIPLVVFGHMHHRLNSRHGHALRRMAHIDPSTGTAYLNAAVVPRVQKAENGDLRHFMIVNMLQGRVADAQHVWISVRPSSEDAPSQQSSSLQEDRPQGNTAAVECQKAPSSQSRWLCSVWNEEPLLRTDSSSPDVLVRTTFDAHSQEWEAPVASKTGVT